MALPKEVELELDRARSAETEGNEGKARVCARRAVGRAFVLSSYSTEISASFNTVQTLKGIAALEVAPPHVRDAARRLSTGVAESNGLSVSMRPIEDALIVISWLLRI